MKVFPSPSIQQISDDTKLCLVVFRFQKGHLGEITFESFARK